MLSKRPIRIKSPQLYQLSYRPKLLQLFTKIRTTFDACRSGVSVVYPGAAPTVIPQAPDSEDDVFSSLRRVSGS